ncbi:MAG: hypothetical protein D6732_09650 [Methanobacteriota archaeon]|nr:MAG: hypothetical protein D6732_09650 [Euryarchaeota archaeon]
MVKKVDEWSGKVTQCSKCRRCKLFVSNEFMSDDGLCKACENLNIIYVVGGIFSKLFPLGILLAGLIWFFSPELRFLLLPILLLIVAPAFLTGVFQLQIHMMGIPKSLRPVPIIRAYDFIRSYEYYDGALKYWKSVEHKDKEQTKQVIDKLLKFIILTDKPTPNKWVTQWSEASGFSKKEFVEFMITDMSETFKESLKPKIGYGVLPDLWDGLKESSEDAKRFTFDVILEYVQSLDDFLPFEQKVFTEELYVISDELIPELENLDSQKYRPIIDLITNFVPDEVPKNRLDAMVKASELQTKIGQLSKQKMAAKLQNRE